MMKKFAIFALLVTCILSIGWFTKIWDTHWYLMDDVLKADEGKFNADEYPDIWMYLERIRAGAECEQAHAPNKGWANTGDMQAMWNGERTLTGVYAEKKPYWKEGRNVRDYYKGRDFKNAYWALGCMLHLVEDMTVPPHAYDIPHSGSYLLHKWNWPLYGYGATGRTVVGYNVDDMENYAARYYPDELTVLEHFFVEPDDPVEFYGKSAQRVRWHVNKDDPVPPIIEQPEVIEELESWEMRVRLAHNIPDTEPMYLYFYETKGAVLTSEIPEIFQEKHHWVDYWREGKQDVHKKLFGGTYGFRKFPPWREETVSSDVGIARRVKKKNFVVLDTKTLVVGWWRGEHDRFASQMLANAAGYGAGMLAAASRALPPLLCVEAASVAFGTVDVVESSSSMENQVFVNLMGVELLENRKREVKLTVVIEELPEVEFKALVVALEPDAKKRLPYAWGPNDVSIEGGVPTDILKLWTVASNSSGVFHINIVATDEDGNAGFARLETSEVLAAEAASGK